MKREEEKWEERKNEGSPSARTRELAVVAPPHGQQGSVRTRVTTHREPAMAEEQGKAKKVESQWARRGPDGGEQGGG